MRLMVVASAVGLPLEIIALIGGFYRLFDMGTTSMSVMGDLSATVVIDRWEKNVRQKRALNNDEHRFLKGCEKNDRSEKRYTDKTR